MAEEIEKYLRKTIEEEEKNLPKAMANQLKEYLEEKNPNREKLYALNNIITQWQREYKQCKSPIFRCKLRWSFTSNLNKLKQADQPPPPPPPPAAGAAQPEVNQPPPPPPPAAGAAQPEVNQPPPPPPPAAGAAQPEVNQPPPPPPPPAKEDYRWSSRLVDPNKVHGLGEKSMFLQRLLVSPKTSTQFKAIGIVGMRGIGKTTLAQVIFGMPEVKSHFVPRIWVCLSKQPEDDDAGTRKEVVKRMLICLGVEDNVIQSAENRGLEGLLFALRLQLTGKRYLVVLDDVWSTEEGFQKFISSLGSEERCSERLAYGLPKGGCGGAVIVTSRAEKATNEVVGGDNVHRLPLTDDVSIWKMFTDTATEGGLELSQPLESLKEIIVRKCGGLPLAAKMMGEIAHGDLHNERKISEQRPQAEPRLQADTAAAAAAQNESHGGEIGQQKAD